MIRRTPLGHHFIDRIDPVWPEGVQYVRDVVNRGYHEIAEAWRDDEGPLWAWGVVPLWDGVGSVWLLFDRRASRRAFRIVREGRRYLGELDRMGFRRLQGEVHPDAPTRKLAKSLGFSEESVLRNYGIGGEGDYTMLARTI